MKYTRYDLKRKKKKNYSAIIMLASFCMIAVLIVTLISPYIFKGTKAPDAVNATNTDKLTDDVSSYSNFVLIQFGAFEKLENAKNLQSELNKSLTNSYIVTDDITFRVIAGIYSEIDEAKIIKDINDKKIEISQMHFKINQTELCNKEIAEAIGAELQIINALSNKDVKSIQSSDLKKWSSALTMVDIKSLNYTSLQEIESYISKLNANISKADIEQSYNFILKELKTLK